MLVSAAVGTEQLKSTATLAALLSSRDILNYVPDIYSSSDLDHRLDALSVVERGGSRADINVPIAREVLKTRQDFLKILHGLKIRATPSATRRIQQSIVFSTHFLSVSPNGELKMESVLSSPMATALNNQKKVSSGRTRLSARCH